MPSDTNKLATIKQMIHSAQTNLQTAQELLSHFLEESGIDEMSFSPSSSSGQSTISSATVYESSAGGKIIEGVFDGEMMIGPDGNRFPVPPNYASKSKLISGDLLKLTITSTGSFVYKQIGPVERAQTLGVIKKVGNEFYIHCKEGEYRVLTASVTYFRAEPGDNVAVIVPAGSASGWAAIENIIPQGVDVFAENASADDSSSDLDEDEVEDFEMPSSLQ